MFRKLFVDHPASVGESYFEHLVVALGFGLRMIGGGLACIVHALVPGLCKTTGSRAISCLHETMVENRRRKALQAAATPAE
jgi:hypothetical protein